MIDTLTLSQKEIKAKIIAWRSDPVLWCYDVLGVELDKWQREAIEALMLHQDRVAIRSGNGPGKTMWAAVSGLHFLDTRPDSLVICTAPSLNQLFNALWREAQIWYNKSPWLQANFEFTATMIYRRGFKNTWCMKAQTAQVNKDTNTAEGLQGIHGKHVLAIVDEASGVPEPVMSAIENALTTAGNKIALIGNPLRTLGFFYDVFKKHSHRWFTLQVNTELVTRVSNAFKKLIAEQYGKDSVMYGIKVRGEFPEGAIQNWIHPEDFYHAIDNYSPIADPSSISIGWDIAGEGTDSTAMALFFDAQLEEVNIFKKNRVDQVVELIRSTRSRFPGAYQYVDAIGIGKGVVDVLHSDIYVRPIIVSHSSSDPAVFASYGAELAFSLKRSFEIERVTINPRIQHIKMLREDLCERKFEINENTGKSSLEPKKHFRDRHTGRSPDIGDAVMIGWAGIAKRLMAAPQPGQRAPINLSLPQATKPRFSFTTTAYSSSKWRFS